MSGAAPKQHITELAELSGIFNEKLREGGSVTFSPRGVSMLPMLRAYGDKVTLVKPPVLLKKGTVALFILKNAEGGSKFVLHRLVKIKDDKLIFCGDRRLDCDPPVEYGDVVGVVSEYWSRGRQHTVREPLYRLYSFWMVHTVKVRGAAQKLQDAVYRIWKRLGGGRSSKNNKNNKNNKTV